MMAVLTKNEKKVLRLLAVSFAKDYSINDIARRVNITPNGAYKILQKFGNEEILKVKSIANIKAYKLNFDSEKTSSVLELAFMPEILEGRVKIRASDLKPLRTVTKTCILFGSYITTKKDPEDLDILFVFEQSNYSAYKKSLEKVRNIIPIKIQDVIQTFKDLQKNLKAEDKIIIESLRNGIVLWGFDTIIRVIKNVHAR